nr:hypothetical protein [Actinomadura sp. CNU-125]
MQFVGQVVGQQFGTLALHDRLVLQQDAADPPAGVAVGPPAGEEVPVSDDLDEGAVPVERDVVVVEDHVAERQPHVQLDDVRQVPAVGDQHLLGPFLVQPLPQALRGRRAERDVGDGGPVVLDDPVVGDLRLVRVAEPGAVDERRVRRVHDVLERPLVVRVDDHLDVDGAEGRIVVLGEAGDRRALVLRQVAEERPDQPGLLPDGVGVDAGLLRDAPAGRVRGDPRARAVRPVPPAVVGAGDAVVAGERARRQRGPAVHAQVGQADHAAVALAVEDEVLAEARDPARGAGHRVRELDRVPEVLEHGAPIGAGGR